MLRELKRLSLLLEGIIISLWVRTKCLRELIKSLFPAFSNVSFSLSLKMLNRINARTNAVKWSSPPSVWCNALYLDIIL